MTEVIYPGPLSAVVLPDGTVCNQGKPVTVSDEIAENLIRQGFVKPAPKSNDKDGK